MSKQYVITFLMEQKYTVNIQAENEEEAENKMIEMPLVQLLALANRTDEYPFEVNWLSTEEKEHAE